MRPATVMKIFLVGATGRTGKWILKEALAQGYQVTALVREPSSRLGLSDANLKVISGDLFKIDDLSALISGHDAIISALGSSAVEDGTLKLISAAETAGVPRFLGVAGGGILQLDEDRLRRERPGYPQVFVQSSARHLNAWKALEASSLQWTLLCTPDLADKPATGQAKHLVNYMPAGGNSVACGDVAEFLVTELKASQFLKTRVGFTM